MKKNSLIKTIVLSGALLCLGSLTFAQILGPQDLKKSGAKNSIKDFGSFYELGDSAANADFKDPFFSDSNAASTFSEDMMNFMLDFQESVGNEADYSEYKKIVEAYSAGENYSHSSDYKKLSGNQKKAIQSLLNFLSKKGIVINIKKDVSSFSAIANSSKTGYAVELSMDALLDGKLDLKKFVGKDYAKSMIKDMVFKFSINGTGKADLSNDLLDEYIDLLELMVSYDEYDYDDYEDEDEDDYETMTPEELEAYIKQLQELYGLEDGEYAGYSLVTDSEYDEDYDYEDFDYDEEYTYDKDAYIQEILSYIANSYVKLDYDIGLGASINYNGIGGKVVINIHIGMDSPIDENFINRLASAFETDISDEEWESDNDIEIDFPLDLKVSVKFYDDKNNLSYSMMDAKSLSDLIYDIRSISHMLNSINHTGGPYPEDEFIYSGPVDL